MPIKVFCSGLIKKIYRDFFFFLNFCVHLLKSHRGSSYSNANEPCFCGDYSTTSVQVMCVDGLFNSVDIQPSR